MNFTMAPPLLGGNLIQMLRSPSGNPFPEVIGTFMGRDALALAVSYLNLCASDKVLLPAYVCREALRPFLGKTQVKFYDVGPDLVVDPEDLKQTLSRDKVKALLIINYFGFLQPLRKQIKQIASDRGTFLIEDCAHSLLTAGSGETGDLAVYSFRKILPLPDGGGLKLNVKGQSGGPRFYPKIYSNILSLLAITKSLLNVQSEILSRAGLSPRRTALMAKAASPNRQSRILPLSSFAYNGMGNLCLADIITQRRRDYQFWQKVGVQTNIFTPIFIDLPPGVCPLGVPVKATNRDFLKKELQKLGVPVKIHWQLPSTIGGEFAHSRELSTQILTLPVYPELTAKGRSNIDRALTPGGGCQ